MPLSPRRSSVRSRFEALALPHLDSVYRVACSIMGSPQDAEDMVQETFLKAYRRFYQLRDPGRCRQWLLRILRTTCINEAARSGRRPSAVPLDIDPESGLPSPEEALFGRLLDDEVMGALDALPEEYRTAVMLSDIEGLTYKETADAMGCPLGTVRSRLNRGRELLAWLLEQAARERGYLKERQDGDS